MYPLGVYTQRQVEGLGSAEMREVKRAYLVTSSKAKEETAPTAAVEAEAFAVRGDVTTRSGAPRGHWELNMGGEWAASRGGKTYRHLLTVVDGFSRAAMAIPLTSKRSEEVAEALKGVFKHMGHPKRIECDGGGEFKRGVQRLLDKLEIPVRRGVVSIHRQQSLVERFHSTLEKRMIKWMRTVGDWSWLTALKGILVGYNTTIHSTIGTEPRVALVIDSLIGASRNLHRACLAYSGA